MKKYFFIAILGLAAFSTQVKAQDISALKDQKEALKLSLDLIDKKIDLAKEQKDNEKIQGNVNDLNKKSDRKSDSYSPSDAESTAKDAKKTAKVLKEAESANKDLVRSNEKIADLQKDISKLQDKLNKQKYTVEIKEK